MRFAGAVFFVVNSPEYTGTERRRSARLMRKVSLRLTGVGADGQTVNESAEAIVISAHGALIKADSKFSVGSQFTLEGEAGRRGQVRVIWVREKPLEGQWEMGVELQPGETSPWTATAS